MGAGSRTVPAADALSMVGRPEHIHIHSARMTARPAGGAPARVHLQAADGNSVAQPVKGPQRAQPLAERPVEKHRQQSCPQQDAALPGK